MVKTCRSQDHSCTRSYSRWVRPLAAFAVTSPCASLSTSYQIRHNLEHHVQLSVPFFRRRCAVRVFGCKPQCSNAAVVINCRAANPSGGQIRLDHTVATPTPAYAVGLYVSPTGLLKLLRKLGNPSKLTGKQIVDEVCKADIERTVHIVTIWKGLDRRRIVSSLEERLTKPMSKVRPQWRCLQWPLREAENQLSYQNWLH